MEPQYIQISSKGQVVIPADVREELNLKPGTRLSLQRDGQTLILRPITPEYIRSLVGITQGAGDVREHEHRDDEER
jgi:AbrB family looped-hinge helix DNA binding protein